MDFVNLISELIPQPCINRPTLYKSRGFFYIWKASDFLGFLSTPVQFEKRRTLADLRPHTIQSLLLYEVSPTANPSERVMGLEIEYYKDCGDA